jgi:hypothetical protein
MTGVPLVAREARGRTRPAARESPGMSGKGERPRALWRLPRLGLQAVCLLAIAIEASRSFWCYP